MNDTTNAIITSMNKMIKNLESKKTRFVNCAVTKVYDTNDKYEVMLDLIRRDTMNATNITFKKNDIVRVCIPNGKLKDRFIIGKYKQFS